MPLQPEDQLKLLSPPSQLFPVHEYVLAHSYFITLARSTFPAIIYSSHLSACEILNFPSCVNSSQPTSTNRHLFHFWIVSSHTPGNQSCFIYLRVSLVLQRAPYQLHCCFYFILTVFFPNCNQCLLINNRVYIYNCKNLTSWRIISSGTVPIMLCFRRSCNQAHGWKNRTLPNSFHETSVNIKDRQNLISNI